MTKETHPQTPEKELRSFYEQAQRYIKISEEINGEIPIPAVNELRNAGYHIVKFIANTPEENKEYEYIRAKSHIQRACYEALDASLIFLIEIIKEFKNSYKNYPISNVIPDYHDALKAVKQAKTILEQGRDSSENRDNDFRKREECVKQLKKFTDNLDIYREEIDTRISHDKRQRWINFFLTLISGIIVGLLTAYIFS